MTAFDDLSLPRTFVCIVECGSISAGARHLNIPQPTLSRYLRVLEEYCGTALLRRDTHRMNLTQTGQRLLEDARTMLAHAEAADQRLREDQTMLSGHLRLFATMDLGQSIVTRGKTCFPDNSCASCRSGTRKTYRFTSSISELASCRRACAPSSTSPSAT